jgi:hypothetical protein
MKKIKVPISVQAIYLLALILNAFSLSINIYNSKFSESIGNVSNIFFITLTVYLLHSISLKNEAIKERDETIKEANQKLSTILDDVENFKRSMRI